MTRSALYAGAVVHQRHRPKAHRLGYRVFALLLDLDELPALGDRLRLFGYNRAGLFSFHDADHGDGSGAPLRPFIEQRLAEAGIALDGGSISILCYPRILGYAFNPLTEYFCHDRTGALLAIVHEVTNTFGERIHYVLPAAAEADGKVRQACDKALYVSPFVGMAAHYRFRIVPPADNLVVSIAESDVDGVFLLAAFAARRVDLDDRALLRAFFAYPLMTLKVTWGIHWHALRLFLKGVPFHAHRAARPAQRTMRRVTAKNSR